MAQWHEELEEFEELEGNDGWARRRDGPHHGTHDLADPRPLRTTRSGPAPPGHAGGGPPVGTELHFLDYRHYDRDSANVLAGATGDFKKQFAAQTEQLTQLVATNKSVSEGQVLEAGIVRSDESSARVLVVADSKVTNTAVPHGEARTYRLQLDLVHRDGRWLTSDVEFVG